MENLKATAEDIRHAYRLLLGREPDAAGEKSFNELIARQHVNAPDLGSHFLTSTEFQQRHSAVTALDPVPFGSVTLYPWRGDGDVGAYVKETGAYEPHVFPQFLAEVPLGGVVLDIGANIGTYALSAAHKVGQGGHVVAVEPLPRNVQSLCAGVHGNGFGNVSILPVAASASAGVIAILRNAASSNAIVDAHVRTAGAESFVPTQRLDVLLAHLTRLDVVKMDIEGHEPVAWPGIEALLTRHRPVVFTEFSPGAIRNHSRVEPEAYLRQLFAYADKVEILHVDGRRVVAVSTEQVMAEWAAMSERLGRPGVHHLDLVARPQR